MLQWLFLEIVDDLEEERYRMSPGSTAISIAYHLWHTARWADAFQERFGSDSTSAREAPTLF